MSKLSKSYLDSRWSENIKKNFDAEFGSWVKKGSGPYPGK